MTMLRLNKSFSITPGRKRTILVYTEEAHSEMRRLGFRADSYLPLLRQRNGAYSYHLPEGDVTRAAAALWNRGCVGGGHFEVMDR